MTRFKFENLIRDAIASLPRHIGDAMDNVAFVIEKKKLVAHKSKMQRKLFCWLASVSERRRGGSVVPLKMGSYKV